MVCIYTLPDNKMKSPITKIDHLLKAQLPAWAAIKSFLKRRKWVVLIVFLAIIAIKVELGRTAERSEANTDPRTDIQAFHVSKVTQVASVDSTYTGIIEARVLSPIGFRVSGKVIKRYVDKGQEVKMGEPLMSLDPTDFTLNASAATQQLQANEATKTQAEADRLRFARVVGAGAVSPQKYDIATASADASDANVLAAKAQAQIAANAQSYTTIYAEADGVIVDTMAEPGQVVQAGQPVIQLAFKDAPEAVVNLPETVSMKLGTTATAYLMDDESTPHKAHLRQLAAQADPVLRTFEARFPLDDNSQEARLGSTVTIKLSHKSQWFQVPVGALLDRGQGYAVWVFNSISSTVSERHVSVERITESAAIVSEGLTEDEQVVDAGAHRLFSGEKIIGSVN